MATATVSAGARLHVGFQNLSLARERLYGGIGVGLAEPRVTVTAEPAPTVQADDPLVRTYASRAVDILDVTGVAVDAEESLPRHVGLGSGTQIALAVLAATARAHGLEPRVRARAPAMGQGGRSGSALRPSRAAGSPSTPVTRRTALRPSRRRKATGRCRRSSPATTCPLTGDSSSSSPTRIPVAAATTRTRACARSSSEPIQRSPTRSPASSPENCCRPQPRVDSSRSARPSPKSAEKRCLVRRRAGRRLPAARGRTRRSARGVSGPLRRRPVVVGTGRLRRDRYRTRRRGRSRG